LPSEEEWEYVAREGGASHRGKTYADWHRGTSDLHAHPAFAPLAALVPREEAEDEIDALAREEEEAFAEEHLGEGFHALGVWGLEFGEWVAGPEARHRGGGVLHYPWQDSPEVLSAHPANRGEGGAFGDLATARPVLDLR
jgi:hypothetical protein